jgi:hypothetical protein
MFTDTNTSTDTMTHSEDDFSFLWEIECQADSAEAIEQMINDMADDDDGYMSPEDEAAWVESMRHEWDEIADEPCWFKG